jgi:CO/xanthine dehydrogenase Mo-binding subunit
VAVVFAETAYQAEDAAEHIGIDFENLPVIVDGSAPPGAFAPDLSTESVVMKQGYGDAALSIDSEHLGLELDLYIGRHAGVPLEPRGALARLDRKRDVLELYGAAKVPHRNRATLARYFGREPERLHLYEGHVGGGFGIRGELYPEDFLVCAAAMALDRPVKWIEDRREHLMAANQSREQRHKLRATFDRQGTLLELEDEFFHDQGAYVRTHGARVIDLTMGMLPGPYRIPAYRACGRQRLTNKTPAATYRAPGRYEGTFVRERLLDIAAHRLGLDRIAIRRRNLIAAAEMPFARGLGALDTDVVYDSGDYEGLLDKALDRFGWPEREARIAARRDSGELAGLGVAMFVEKSGLGPTDKVRIEMASSGGIEIVTGSASLGQGIETALAQICAEVLAVDHRSLRVIHGQTDRIDDGIGAHATRATVMTGSATYEAALSMKRQILDAGAKLLQAPAESLDLIDGVVCGAGGQDGPSIALAEIARSCSGLIAEGIFNSEHMTYPYGVHLAQVSVDSATGFVTVEDYLIAYDVGRAVNPAMVEGQIAGGFVQGLGGALYEEFRYSESGDPLSVTLADYLIPTLSEVPPLDILITEDAPSPLNPLGLKGAGEGGCNAVGAAIASAVGDALGDPAAITRLPMTLARIRAILRSRDSR